MEIWKDVVGYEGIYEVSNTGKVRTHKDKTTFSEKHGVRKWKQRTLKQKFNAKGNDYRVSLYKNGSEKTWLVHRLVALAFLPREEGRDYVNHIDGSRLNNHMNNLEWCNHKENNNHAFDTRLIKTGHEIMIYDTDSKLTYNFRSKSKAGEFLGKSHSFVSGLLKKGESRYMNYLIKEKKAN